MSWTHNGQDYVCGRCQMVAVEPFEHECDGIDLDGEFATDLDSLGVEAQPQSIPELFKRWQFAVRKWRRAGKPTRTDEEVAGLLEICQACPSNAFKGSSLRGGYCSVCGCGANLLRLPLFNKLRMSTESCPHRHW